jgi:carbon monoxide dehydrogenase subunit G
MKLENEFRVPVPVDRAWEVLTDIPEIAPCLPGAKLTGHDGDTYEGMVKIKVGPVTAEYSGTAEFVERDEANKHVVIKAKGRDKRGSGNASADITANMIPDGDGTRVTIDTDLKISGKVAQFGKGVIADVSAKLIGQFVDCIEGKLTAPVEPAAGDAAGVADAAGEAASAAGGAVADAAGEVADAASGLGDKAGAGVGAAAAAAGGAAAAARSALPDTDVEPEALDLMDVAGGAMMKRLIPPLVVLAVVIAIILFFVL